MQDITDEILSKAQEGDIRSFEVIYRATAGFVYNVARRIVYNTQDAEEVTQEVFLSVYHKLKYFRAQSAFKTWVYRIAVNCAINHSKKMAREREKREEYQNDAERIQVNEKPAAGNEWHREMIDTLLKILNPDQRICVVLRSIEGLSYQEIAGILKISINTVRSRLARAREKMMGLKEGVVADEL